MMRKFVPLFCGVLLLFTGLLAGYFLSVASGNAGDRDSISSGAGGDKADVGGKKDAGKTPRRARPAAPIRVELVRKNLISNARLFHGRLVEVQRSRISTEVSGLVRELPIEIGMKVKGGETLFAQIDTTWLSLIIEQTEAEILSLEHRLTHEKSELKRLNSAGVEAVFTESDRSQQRALVEQYIQDLEKAKIANREAKEKLHRATILAPYDGYVIRRETGVNELLSPGTPIAEIVMLGEVDARIMVSEDVIDRIKVGDEVPVIVDSLNIRVVGKVHRIVPYAPTGARIFPVLVRLSDKEGHLKVGMSITAEIVTSNPSEEIIVSKDAVLDRPDGAVVWVAVEENKKTDDDNNKSTFIAKPIPVKIKVTAITHCGVVPETDEGKKLLVSGAKAIIEGAERLTANQQIRIDQIDPKLLENLSSPNGQKIINPKTRFEN
ncbi:MAG: efflux RND transporter periplasmic adaptor subunit [Planctomycetaceae bacterium]|jgi:RND family efflux transporter MFP subunit|nr:efflux RND transporter periplasmic adaptor subunit [Planctomycetaceae bacterium]